MVHEIQFYAVFLLFFISARLFTAVLLLWAGTILVCHLVFTPTGWVRYPLNILNIEFMFGVLAAWIVVGPISRIVRPWLLIPGALISLFSLVIMTPDNASIMRLFFSFGLMLVVIGFALIESVSTLKWPSILLLMGNASYSIYLIHNPLLSVTQRLAGQLELGWLEALIGGVFVSLLVGLVYYHLVEHPLLRFFRKLIKRV